MNPLKLPLALSLALAASMLSAQTGQIGGPMIGFVFDNTAGALRPVRGILGASMLGDPVDTGLVLSSAVVAPRQDTAAATATDGSFHLLRLNSGSSAPLPCAACPATTQAAIFSPSGTAVAFYSAGRVRVVTGLPDAPAAGAGFDVEPLSRGAGNGPQTPDIARSDDGAWLRAATRNSVELFGANGGIRPLMDTKPYPLIAFAAGSHDAVVADPGGAGLVLFHDVAGASTQQVLALPDARRGPSALAFSPDGTRILVAVPLEQSVVSIDVASGNRTVTTCHCTASALVSMGKLFRLNESDAGPLWLMDPAALPEPLIVFVPALTAN